MTGEISLRGYVLPIGGLREKTMAAYRMGIKTVIIPKKNLPDLKEIDGAVKSAIEFEAVSRLDEVFDIALAKNESENQAPQIKLPNKKTYSAVHAGGSNEF